MILQTLYLKNFRNFSQLKVAFGPGINWIYGDNAQGKSTLLEAIYLLSCGRSFRTQRLQGLIRNGESSFSIEAHCLKEGVSHVVGVTFDGTVRKMHYNGTPSLGFTKLFGLLPTVLITPVQTAIIDGPPSERRRFLNLHLAQIDPLYIQHFSRYTKAMRQRNHLLQAQKLALIEPWEQIMAESGTYLVHKRVEALSRLEPLAAQHVAQLSNAAETLTLSYQPCQSKESASLREQWCLARAQEAERGYTLIGPHRDEVEFLLSGMPARYFASQGQKQCVLWSLRMGEWWHTAQRLGSPPLLAIDDVGVYLDQQRSAHLHKGLHQLGQVILTCPVPSPHSPSTLIRVKNGGVNLDVATL